MIIIIGAAVLLTAAVIILFIIFKKNKSRKKDFYSASLKSEDSLGRKLRKLFGGKVLSQNEYAELEEVLIKADMGPKISSALIEKLSKKNPKDIEGAINILKEEISCFIKEEKLDIKKGELNVLLILGVNGVGKTTSIAKLGSYFLKNGLKVFFAAGDTFRAAAIEQLSHWAERLKVTIVKQKENSDPSGVVFDAVDSAKAKGADILLIDTAGRFHNKQNLIEELKKIERIIEKKGVAKKNILVLDATTGQNAFLQAESFNQAIGIDGIIVTKYDSLSKAGIVLNIEKNLNIPFYYVGYGEKIENIKEFSKNEFIENIFN